MLLCRAAAFGRRVAGIAFPPRSGTAFDSANREEAKMAVKPIPEGYPSLIPYLIVADGSAAIAFYQNVFGARLRMRLDGPGGKIGHAELEIGNSLIMLADEHPEMGALSPKTVGGTPVGLHVYLEDVDAVAAKAVAAGATLKRPVENQFYGDRLGSIVDPFGHLWHISTHVEDVSPEEIGRRAAAMAQGQQGQGQKP
jgi:PhnB protein